MSKHALITHCIERKVQMQEIVFLVQDLCPLSILLCVLILFFAPSEAKKTVGAMVFLSGTVYINGIIDSAVLVCFQCSCLELCSSSKETM